ncbi:hypothetical protein FACS1894184_16120 [Clostridia bacterium]|nr:hypothetical protein FACS1894184_16120 [Clostridia bacterium]
MAENKIESTIVKAFNAIDFDETFDIDKLDITSDLVFSAVILYYPAIAIDLIKLVYPHLNISKIIYVYETVDEATGKVIKREKQSLTPVEIQQVLMNTASTRGVRLDVYIDDGQNIINVEMQAVVEPFLEKRFRVLAAMSDGVQLRRGATYDQLRDLYIIFFYKHDPTDEKRYRYERVTVYEHNRDRNIDTHKHEVILFTGGVNGADAVTPDLIELLRYFNNPKSYPVGETKLDVIKKLASAVDKIKDISEWRDYVMTILVKQRQAELKGIEIGRTEGIGIGRTEGIGIGRTEGIGIGEQRGLEKAAKSMYRRGIPIIDIASDLGHPEGIIQQWVAQK